MQQTTTKPEKILTLKEMIDDYISAGRIEGKSEQTIDQYDRVLYAFASIVSSDPKRVTASDIRKYLAFGKEKGWAKATVWTHYKNLSAFFNFCCGEDYLEKNPTASVSKPRVPKTLPRILTEDEIRALLKAAKARGFLGKRNTALIALLFDSGLRASEICGLKLEDVSLENQVVKVFGKGSKERIIPFSKETAKLLLRYLKVRRDFPFEEGFFVTKNGDGFNRYILFRTVKRLAERAGIDPSKASPHVLRHSFATSWIRAGGDTKRLQHMLGHSDPRIVDVYIHLTAKDLSQAHSEFSPLSHL